MEHLQIRMVSKQVVFWIRQGHVKHKVCSVQSGFIASMHGPMVRLQLDDRRAMSRHKSKVVILGGLLAQEPEEAAQSLTTYLDASERSNPEIFWPQPCEDLKQSEHWLQISEKFMAAKELGEWCVLDKLA